MNILFVLERVSHIANDFALMTLTLRIVILTFYLTTRHYNGRLARNYKGTISNKAET